MPSLADLFRQERRRRVWRVAALALCVPLAMYAYFFALSFTPRYKAIPAEVWELGPAAVRDAVKYGPSAFTPPPGWQMVEADPSRGAVSLADLWVAYVNAANPGAIFYHDIDAFGNLYVVFGQWWLDLDPDQQLTALNHFGRYWRSYLHANVGPWDVSSGFAPGVIVVDTKGRVAHNVNGEAAVFRQPEY
jgi:hypothetical protein